MKKSIPKLEVPKKQITLRELSSAQLKSVEGGCSSGRNAGCD